MASKMSDSLIVEAAACTNSHRLVVGDVNGQFRAVIQKLGALHAKSSFSLALIVGNLFANPQKEDSGVDSDIQLLINGEIDIPLPVYFALGSFPLPPQVVDKLESSNDELCHNLFFIGRRATIKTSEGIRIVALGGQLNPGELASAAKKDYCPFYSEADANTLLEATKTDILITNEWPKDILLRSKVNFRPDVRPLTQSCVADLNIILQPRYHFSVSNNDFFEREPFFHNAQRETSGIFSITRFISLASYGNLKKQKWIYAFSLETSNPNAVAPPAGSTACPLTFSKDKRSETEQREQRKQTLVYDDRSRGHRPHKRRKREVGPLLESECFFCFANENFATHLVASIAENSYLTTAKGPLSSAATFPKLGFPCHMLIIPLNHSGKLNNLELEERQATYAEMEKFCSSMDGMLKSFGGTDYGSVAWEFSKSSLPHMHWQYLPVTADLIRKGLVVSAFKALAENFRWPDFQAEDVEPSTEDTGDFFRFSIWNSTEEIGKRETYIMRIDDSIRFHTQFGREVLAKLLMLDDRIDWRDCGQTQAEEERDVDNFKNAFKQFDFTT